MQPNDHCDRYGAERLGKIITEYWAKRGMIVRLEYVDAPFVPQMRTARVDIRSNMVNGMPRRTPGVLSRGRLPSNVVLQSLAKPLPTTY